MQLQRRKPGFSTVRSLAVLVSLTALAAAPVRGQEPPPAEDDLGGRSWAPILTTRVPPRPDARFAPRAASPPALRRIPRMSARPAVHSDRYRALKAEARSTSVAQPPDTVLAAPASPGPLAAPRSDSADQESFPGLDFLSAFSGSSVPDPTLGKGPTRVLEAANAALRLTASDGSEAVAIDLETFFGEPPGTFLFSPRVVFDRAAKNRRFYVVASQPSGADPAAAASYLHLAVSRSADPLDFAPASWCRYKLDGRSDIGTPDVGWADHTNLGMGTDTLLISTNQYRVSDGTFSWNYVRAIDKLALANNATRCPGFAVFTFAPAAAPGDFFVFGLQPVQHYTRPSSFPGASNPAYLVNNRYLSSDLYRVWRVRNMAGGAPVLDAVDVAGSYFYSFPPDAPQRGNAGELDTGDTRVTQAAGLGDALWAVHGTGCALGGGGNEACVRAVRILVGQDQAGDPTADLSQETTFGGGDGIFFWWPGVAVNQAEQAAIAFENSSAGTFLNAWYSVKDLASPAFETASSIADGTCPQGGGNGDYVGAATDPADFDTFWLAGQRNTVVAGWCTWQIWIVSVGK